MQYPSLEAEEQEDLQGMNEGRSEEKYFSACLQSNDAALSNK